MSYLLENLGGLLGATLLAPMLFCVAGFGLLRLLDRAGLAAAEGFWPRAGWAMLLSLAILPVLDVLAIRAIGMPGMLLLNGALALFGINQLRGITPACRGTGAFLLVALGWWLICAWTLMDFDRDGRLYQSLVVFDMVKHGAVIEQIARQGIPFTDPFFARDGIGAVGQPLVDAVDRLSLGHLPARELQERAGEIYVRDELVADSAIWDAVAPG